MSRPFRRTTRARSAPIYRPNTDARMNAGERRWMRPKTRPSELGFLAETSLVMVKAPRRGGALHVLPPAAQLVAVPPVDRGVDGGYVTAALWRCAGTGI